LAAVALAAVTLVVVAGTVAAAAAWAGGRGSVAVAAVAAAAAAAGGSGDVGGGGIGSGNVGGRGSASGNVGSSGRGSGGAAAAAAAAAEAKIPNGEQCDHHPHFPESGSTCKGIHSKEKKVEKVYFYLRHKNCNIANLAPIFRDARSGTIANKNQQRITAGTHFSILLKLNAIIFLLNW
jgi:hypothetical protein